MSAFQQHAPLSIVNYKGNNTNIPNAFQLNKYFFRMSEPILFIYFRLLVDNVFINDVPIKNMFKLLYVPLDTHKYTVGKKKAKKLYEPTYISIDCKIDFSGMEKNAEQTTDPFYVPTLMFDDKIYYKPVKKLNEFVNVEDLHKEASKKNSDVGILSLSELENSYSLYYFKDNISFEFQPPRTMFAKICNKHFQDASLYEIAKTIDDESYACSVIELNASFMAKLPKIDPRIRMNTLDEESIVSFIFNKSDDRYIELPSTPIEVKVIEDEPINYCPNASINCRPLENSSSAENIYTIDATNNKRKIPIAEEPANVLYETYYPSRGIVFTNQPVLEEPEPRVIVRATKRLRYPYGGKKQNKIRKTQKIKKSKKIEQIKKHKKFEKMISLFL